MVASAVSVHDGMTLNALAAAAKSADIRICLTVTEHFGGGAHTAGRNDSSTLRFKSWREHMGRPYVMTPRQLRAALTSQLPARCHHVELLN